MTLILKKVKQKSGLISTEIFDDDKSVRLVSEDVIFDETKTPQDACLEFRTNISINIDHCEIDFMIKEMVCALKQLEGEYTFVAGTLIRLYSQILKQVSYGNIYVYMPIFGNKDCNIAFAEGWEEYDVPKNWEGENPLAKPIYVQGKPPKRTTTKRNSISGTIRQNVFMRDNYTCQICGRTIKDGVSLHLDHIIPKSKGGSDSENNLQCLCNQCNLEKHNRTDLLHDKLKLAELAK